MESVESASDSFPARDVDLPPASDGFTSDVNSRTDVGSVHHFYRLGQQRGLFEPGLTESGKHKKWRPFRDREVTIGV